MTYLKCQKNVRKLENFSSIEWLTTQAVTKHKEGKAEEAIAFYLEVIELDENQPSWVYGNVITLMAQGKHLSKGQELEEKALKIYPESAEIYRAAGVLHEKQQDIDNCIEQYQKAISLEPMQPDWLYCNLAKQLIENEQISKAIKISQQGIEYYPDFYPLHYTLGVALTADLRWKEALSAYRRVQELNPSWSEIEAKLNQAIYHQTQIEFQSKLNLNQNAQSSEELLALGDKFFELQRWQEAEVSYKKASELDNNQVWIFYNLGRALAKQGKNVQAIEAYYQTIKIAPEFPDVYPVIGDLLYEQQRWQEASQAYIKAVEFYPHFAWGQYNLGRTLLKLNDEENATQAYLKTIEIDAEFVLAYPKLVQLLNKQQLWEKLRQVCQQSLDKNADWQEAYFYLAKAQNQLGNYDDAIATYHLVVTMLPNRYEIYEGLGDAYRLQLKRDNWNLALDIANQKKALENYYLALEMKPKHIPLYHKILSIEPKNAAMYAQLAKALEANEQLNSAIQFFYLAKNLAPENIAYSLQLYRAIEQQNKKSSHRTKASEVIDLTKLQQQLILRCDFQPLVSIIIPVYNKVGYTLNCLKSIQEHVSKAVSIEVIVVDDGSSDETPDILDRILGLRYIKNPNNMGFINSCNNGASKAKGKYLCFLNNDTEVCPNWLETMVDTIEQDPEVGVVGSKLVYPNGILQEAGGIIWSDAGGWNYGRMGNPDAPEFNYLREVDYCSGASLVVKKTNFDSLDGFEREFVPAYYEDTDLCFAVRNQLKLKVVYQPKSQIVHYEGISSGTSTTGGVKKYQAINSVKFANKWQQALQSHCQPGNPLNPLLAPRRFSGQKVVLIIEHDIPFYDKESGYRRIFEIIKILKAINCHIIYAPDKGIPEQPYTCELQNMGIEVLYRNSHYQLGMEEQIKQVLPIVDFAWICRPDLNQKYAWLVKNQNPQAKIIYDTVDLHYVRLKRAWELLADDSAEKRSLAMEWQGMQAHELDMARQADLTLTVTAVEKDALQQQGIKAVEVIPNIHQPYQGESRSFIQRQGVLFIGGYKHVPNIDCVEWLCNSIMPIVWQTLPNLKVTLLGSHPTEEVKRLASEQVTVTGYIQDVTPYFLSHRIFVSPLRFGAGMKGKIGQSLEYGLPVISTRVGAEGMGLTDNQNVLIADEERYFAEQIIRLHEDEKLWNCLADNSQVAITPYTSEFIQLKLKKLIDSITQ
jgi:O-antigen biosynthesis protein